MGWGLSQRLCGVAEPVIAIMEAMILRLGGCFDIPPHTHKKLKYSFDDFLRISNNSLFSVNEVEALFELFNKLSSSIVDDGVLNKEEFRLAILKSSEGENFFLDRVFDLFDSNKNGVIEFEEFVNGISVFHPHALMDSKSDFAFRLYDLRQVGFIEREEVWQMLNAVTLESGMKIPKESLESIIDKTFADADVDMDGKINKEEWKAFVARHPSLLNNMTLPYLRNITTLLTSFIFNTRLDDQIVENKIFI